MRIREDTKTKIEERLKALRKYKKILIKLGKVTAKELENDDAKRSIAERQLELATEVCIDIAEMLIAELGLRTPEDTRNVIDILGQSGVIDDEFSFNFSGIVGFRNILAYDYLKIDYKKVADNLNNHLSDFDTFARQVAKFLTKH